MAKYTTEDFKKQVRELYPNIEILSNTFSLILLILIGKFIHELSEKKGVLNAMAVLQEN